MFSVSVEKRNVVLSFNARKRDVLMCCIDAEELVHALREKAMVAELCIEPALSPCTEYGCRVESYDGFVAIRWDRPLSVVPLPFTVARKLADLIEFKFQQAKYKMRFEFANN